ncbi:hypothetical protein [Oerskovia enterophila]|uniref:hypothetical protein n=1 Tax=Oerskovia enterophila TaxID=43678 RepID=UPI003391D433
MRRPSTRPVAVTALGLSGILLLSACSGGGAPAADEDSPLTAYYEEVYGDFESDEQQKKMEEQQRKVEELVATCMSEQGFEYTPVDQSMTSWSSENPTDDPEKYAAEYGYGMTIYQEPSAEEQAEMDAYVDPNQDYVDAMSETEQTAYYTALHGEMSMMEYDEDAEMPEYDPSTAGCYGSAQEEVSGGQQELWESEEMTAFSDATTKLYEDVARDPRLEEVTSKWADCMADAGFDYATPEEPSEFFMNASNDLYSGENPEGPSEEDLTALQDQEKDTAVADYACKTKVGYDKVQRTVQFDLESAFMKDNKDMLDRVAAAYKESQQ